ncbi:MAG: hypothetical protein B7X60_15295 [Polynucleobacter sp. 39-45-136]|nr:MAG: hypothetical protein B7X60_15295 [Polynucleobacter sp. 39-45-136]
MNQATFLDLLTEGEFPAPICVVQECGGFLESHSHPYEVKALVTQGQIDIVIDGIKTSYLANQIHSESYGGKGVQYLASRKGIELQ